MRRRGQGEGVAGDGYLHGHRSFHSVNDFNRDVRLGVAIELLKEDLYASFFFANKVLALSLASERLYVYNGNTTCYLHRVARR